jgi:type 1 glutamine amidotransferase
MMQTIRNLRTYLAILLACAVIAPNPFTPSPALGAESEVKPIRALLVLGGCCHDYETQKNLLSEGITQRAHVEVVIAYDPDKSTSHMNPVYESADWASGFDVVIHDECSAAITDLAIIDRILEPHRQGLPSVVLHCGMHCYRSEGYPQAITPWFEFTGLQSTGHGPKVPIDIAFSGSSPITKGMQNWTTINEELYNNSAGKLLDTAAALASGKQTVKNKKGEVTNDYVIVWTNNYRDTARVFATTLGHQNETVADARYLDLVTRGLLWSCDKLSDQYLKSK